MSIRRLQNISAAAGTLVSLAAAVQREFDTVYKNIGQEAVAVDLPLLYNNGRLGIRPSSATQSGYLSAEDYARFANAVSGNEVTPAERAQWNAAYAHSLAPAAGANSQVQYNDAGQLGASSNFVWNKSTSVLTIAGSGAPKLLVGGATDYGSKIALNNDRIVFGRDGSSGGGYFYNADCSMYAQMANSFWIYNSGFGVYVEDQSNATGGSVKGGLRLQTVFADTGPDSGIDKIALRVSVTDGGTGNKYLASLRSGTTSVFSVALTGKTYVADFVGIKRTASTYALEVAGHAFLQGPDGFNATGEMATLYLGDTSKYMQAIYGTGLAVMVNAGWAIIIDENTRYCGFYDANPAETAIHIYETFSLGDNVVDGYVAAITLEPVYDDGGGDLTVTRHNYIHIKNVAIVNTTVVTDACVFRFNAAAGTHKAVDSGTTKTTPGTVNAWMKINVNGTLHYIPAYTSKTA